MALNGKKPNFADAIEIKSNDFIRLQEQFVSLIQALANIFSDGIVSGLILTQKGIAPQYNPNSGWNYNVAPSNYVEVSEGLAIAENGEILIIESGQITISNDIFWNQVNIPASGRDIWIYKSGEEILAKRPNIIGKAQPVLTRNKYSVSAGVKPNVSQYPAQFKLCTVLKIPTTSSISASISDHVRFNYALKNLTHTGQLLNGSKYMGPKLRGYESIENGSILTPQIGNGQITNDKLANNIDGNKIADNSIDFSKKLFNIQINGIQIQDNSIPLSKLSSQYHPVVVIPRTLMMPIFDSSTNKEGFIIVPDRYDAPNSMANNYSNSDKNFPYQSVSNNNITYYNICSLNAIGQQGSKHYAWVQQNLSSAGNIPTYRYNLLLKQNPYNVSNLDLINFYNDSCFSALIGIGCFRPFFNNVNDVRLIPFVRKISNYIPCMYGFPEHFTVKILDPWLAIVKDPLLAVLTSTNNLRYIQIFPIYAPDGYYISNFTSAIIANNIYPHDSTSNLHLMNEFIKIGAYQKNNTNIKINLPIAYGGQFRFDTDGGSTIASIELTFSRFSKYNDSQEVYYANAYNPFTAISNKTPGTYVRFLQSNDSNLQNNPRPFVSNTDDVITTGGITIWKSTILDIS